MVHGKKEEIVTTGISNVSKSTQKVSTSFASKMRKAIADFKAAKEDAVKALEKADKLLSSDKISALDINKALEVVAKTLKDLQKTMDPLGLKGQNITQHEAEHFMHEMMTRKGEVKPSILPSRIKRDQVK